MVVKSDGVNAKQQFEFPFDVPIELFTDEFFKQPADLPPGEVVDVADSIRLPDDLSPGTYKLSVGVVGEEDTQPVVELGIEGRSEDGWYPLSTMTVSL